MFTKLVLPLEFGVETDGCYLHLFRIIYGVNVRDVCLFSNLANANSKTLSFSSIRLTFLRCLSKGLICWKILVKWPLYVEHKSLKALFPFVGTSWVNASLLAQTLSSTELLSIISKRVEGSQFLNEYSVEDTRFKYHTTFECAYTFNI